MAGRRRLGNGSALSKERAAGRAFAAARWYVVRPAGSRKPATYRCPLCNGLLPALSEHLLVLPEGDPGGRRHAHRACVMAARRAGRFPLREDVETARPGAGLLARVLRLRCRPVRVLCRRR